MQHRLLILLTILCVVMVTACGADTSADTSADASGGDFLDPHKMTGKDASQGGNFACSYMGEGDRGKEECKDEAEKSDLNLSCSLDTAQLLVTCSASGIAGNWYHWWTGDASNPNRDVVLKEAEKDGVVKVDAGKSDLDKNTRQPNTDISVTDGIGTFSFTIKSARTDLSVSMEECVKSQFGGTTGCRTATTITESK